MTSHAYGTRIPRSHYDIILSVTSFATELATPTVTAVPVYVTDTLPRLIYKDDAFCNRNIQCKFVWAACSLGR